MTTTAVTMTNGQRRKSANREVQQRKAGDRIPVRVANASEKVIGSRPLNPKRAARLSIKQRAVDRAQPKFNRALNIKPSIQSIRLQDAKKMKVRTHPAFNLVLAFSTQTSTGAQPTNTFTEGSLVWYPHPTEAFVPAKVIKTIDVDTGGQLVVIENEEAHLANVTGEESRHLRHMDEASVQAMENMMWLPELNEVSILHNLKLRFDTAPFCILGTRGAELDLGADVVGSSQQPMNRFEHGTIVLVNTFKAPGSAVRDYIHRVCHTLVTRLVNTRRHQAVVFSGISGSGKTHFVREFLHRLCVLRRTHKSSNLILLESIKAVYRVLDEFITASTLRNNTSTRAGVSVELLFTSKSGKLVGSRLELLFLDASRIITRRRGEQNFAVLYHLHAYAKANPAFSDTIMLLSSMSSRYLNDDETPSGHKRHQQQDGEKWERLSLLLTTELGLTDETVDTLARVLAAIVNLGCVNFVGPESAHLYEAASDGTPDDATIEVADSSVVRTVAKQLGINPELLEHTLIMKDTKSGSTLLSRSRTVPQSENVRDALAKHLYKRVVTFIQVASNRALSPPHGSDMDMFFWDKVRGVKLIDVVPFEAFERSSFEHLCFNYVNEGVNLQYQAFVARMAQQQVLDATSETKTPLFVSVKQLHNKLRDAQVKQVGVFSLFSSGSSANGHRKDVFGLINKLGRVREGQTDVDMLNKVRSRFAAHSKYIHKPSDEATGCFSILHYPGVVTYDTAGFLRKNTMTLPTALETALWNSSDVGVRELSLLNKDQTLMKEEGEGEGGKSNSSVLIHLFDKPTWDPAWERMTKVGNGNKTDKKEEHSADFIALCATNDEMSGTLHRKVMHDGNRASIQRRVASGLSNMARKASDAFSRSGSNSKMYDMTSEGFRRRKKPVAIRKLIKAFRLYVKPDGAGRLGAGVTALDILVKEYNDALVDDLKLDTTASPAMPYGRETDVDGDNGFDLQFVKCMKSNRLHVTEAFDSEVVLSQLQKVGLLDMCRVRDALGFPVHVGFPHFVQEYACLFPRVLYTLADSSKPDSARRAVLELCNNITRMQLMVPENDTKTDKNMKCTFIIGRSSVLLKVCAHRVLQQARDHALNDMATFLQKCARRYLQRMKFVVAIEDKIEHELELAMKSLETRRIKKWLEVAKLFNMFTMTYYQAVAKLDRLYKERAVQDKLKNASENKNPKDLYDSLRNAKEMRMDGGSYPEVKAAVDVQDKVKAELGSDYDVKYNEFKDNYRSVLGDLNGQLALRAAEIREFEAYESDTLSLVKNGGVVNRQSRQPQARHTYYDKNGKKKKKNNEEMKIMEKKKTRSATVAGGSAEGRAAAARAALAAAAAVTGGTRGGKGRGNTAFQSSTMPGVDIDEHFFKRFYPKVNAHDKVKEIPFILAHFENRMDELVDALEKKYDVKFNEDGSFEFVPEATGVATKSIDVAVSASYMEKSERTLPKTTGTVARFKEETHNSKFVQKLADAVGAASQRVKVKYDTTGDLETITSGGNNGAAAKNGKIAAYEYESEYLLGQV